jgi:type I restriction enzyme, S subunit
MYEFVGSDEWRDISLYDSANWKNGLAFKNIDFSDIGLPILKIAELKNGITEQTKYTDATYSNEVFIESGDMLFAWSGSPKTSIDTFIWDGSDGWLNQHIFKVTPSEFVDAEYLFFLLKSLRPRFVRIALNKQTTGLGHVTVADLKEMRVGIPSRSEQNAIVSVVGPIQQKIDNNRRMNETLEKMARAIFKSWFVDFDPVRTKTEGKQPAHMDAETAALFPSSFGDDGLPVGWSIGPLTKTVELIGGGTPKTKEDSYWGGDIGWFSVVDAPLTSDVWVIDTEKKITKEGLANSSAKLLPLKTTIISARGTVGKTALTLSEISMNQSCYGVVGANGYPPFYTYFSVRKMVSELQANAHGSVFDTITKDTFSSVSGTQPPKENAEAFENTVSSFLDKIAANLIENQALAKLRDTLQPKLMSGKIRVKDAEQEVEAVA